VFKALAPKPSLSVRSILLYTAQDADNKMIALAVANNQLCAGFPVQSRGSETVIVGAVFISITLPIILLRCWSRYSIAKELWWDDWTILAAGVCYTIRFRFQLLTDIVDLDCDINYRHNKYILLGKSLLYLSINMFRCKPRFWGTSMGDTGKKRDNTSQSR
jgi:hypothetical protein